MHRRRAYGGALALLLCCGSLAACAVGAGITPDPDARARLDFDSGEIIMPLDEYDPFAQWQNERLLHAATALDIGRCMSGRGYTYSAIYAWDNVKESPIGDRQYGLWDVEGARERGFSPHDDPQLALEVKDRAAFGDQWAEALELCQHAPSPDLVALMPPGDPDSLVARLQTDAYRAASADPAWNAARESWWECLEAAGLQPRKEAGSWTSEQSYALAAEVDETGAPKNEAEIIRVAYIEAKCNVDTNLSQRLGDLEAGYQQSLIDENRAALNEVGDEGNERVAQLRSFLGIKS